MQTISFSALRGGGDRVTILKLAFLQISVYLPAFACSIFFNALYACSTQHSLCFFACVLCANSACLPAIIKSDSAAALIFFVLFRCFWICFAWFRCKMLVHQIHCRAFPLAKFRLSCTALFILHCWFWICFAVFCKSSALLIAAVDLSPGLLQLPVKLYS